MESLARTNLEARVGIEPTMAELQSTALPLCYRALKASRQLTSSERAILGIISNKSTTYHRRRLIEAKPALGSKASTTKSARQLDI